MEAIALQTRHIVDEMNAKGHAINAIYMSGGQAKNAALMQLFADTCGMPVVLPQSSGAAVVLGAAMLGRFAAELQPGSTDEKADCEARWKIMVRIRAEGSPGHNAHFACQVDMTPPGTLVAPAAGTREKKLLQAKYKIFRESIDIQKRWRKEMEEATK